MLQVILRCEQLLEICSSNYLRHDLKIKSYSFNIHVPTMYIIVQNSL
jgi:hypothetical protein